MFERFRESLRNVERLWLGATSFPFVDRAREAGWSPDSPGQWCMRCGQTMPGTGDAPDPIHAGGAPEGCRDCDAGRSSRARPHWDAVVRLGAYEGLVREAVLEVKFEASRAVGRTLGRHLGETLASLRSGANLRDVPLALVPIPISFRRYVSRGIDHTLELARGVEATAGGTILKALARRHGPSQLSLPASRRAANVRDVFESRLRTSPVGWHLVIVDDVMTTGATMTAACRTLRRSWPPDQQPAAVWVAVVGVTPAKRPDADPTLGA